MATLTVSTTGEGLRRMSEDHGPECHKVEDIEHVRYAGDRTARSVDVLTLTVEQALGIAYDLLYQAVDDGLISGWSVQFHDREINSRGLHLGEVQLPERITSQDVRGG